MPRYITPQFYRRACDDIPDITSPQLTNDGFLARYIARAESAIDAYVGFDPLFGGGYEGHVVGLVQERFDFSTRKLLLPNPAVPVRNVTRIRIHISNSGPDGGGLYAILTPGEVVINNWESYTEIIALTLTYSMASVVWELGLNPPIAEWDCEVGHYLPVYGETLYPDLNTNSLAYYGMRQWWASSYTQAPSAQPNALPPVPPVIYVGGVPQARAVLASALVAGQAYTSLPVQALTQALTNSSTLIVHDGSGQTSAITVTLTAPATIGATSLSIASWTPAVAYAAGTVLGLGYSVNYDEGGVVFSSPPSGTVKADYTYTIPDLVRDAAVDQLTWMLQQRSLSQAGMGSLEQVKNGNVFARRARTDDAEEDQLCARARLKLQGFRPIALA